MSRQQGGFYFLGAAFVFSGGYVHGLLINHTFSGSLAHYLIYLAPPSQYPHPLNTYPLQYPPPSIPTPSQYPHPSIPTPSQYPGVVCIASTATHTQSTPSPIPTSQNRNHGMMTLDDDDVDDDAPLAKVIQNYRIHTFTNTFTNITPITPHLISPLPLNPSPPKPLPQDMSGLDPIPVYSDCHSADEADALVGGLGSSNNNNHHNNNHNHRDSHNRDSKGGLSDSNSKCVKGLGEAMLGLAAAKLSTVKTTTAMELSPHHHAHGHAHVHAIEDQDTGLVNAATHTNSHTKTTTSHHVHSSSDYLPNPVFFVSALEGRVLGGSLSGPIQTGKHCTTPLSLISTH